MKRVIFIIIVFSFSCVMVRAQECIKIVECQAWAQENYPLVKQYNLIRLTEEYNVSNAAKGYLPHFNLSAKATWQTDVPHLPIQLPGITINELSKDQYQALLELNQTVWDGGLIKSQKEIVKSGSEVDRKRLEVELYTLNDRVNQLFFGMLLLKEQLIQNRLYKTELQTNYNKIASYVRNGVANQADLDVIRVEQINADQKEVELLSVGKAYANMLSLLTGKKIGDGALLVKPDDMTIGDGIYRPELQLFDMQDKLYSSQELMIGAKNRPGIQFFVQGGYGRPALNMLEDKFSLFAMGGVRLSWNFGGLYTRKNDYRLIGIGKEELQVQRSVFLFNTDITVTQQRSEIDKIKRLMVSDDEIIVLRQNILKAAEAKVVNGIFTVTDLVREINAKEQAQQTKVLHGIQLLKAVYDLKYTLNTPADRLNPKN